MLMNKAVSNDKIGAAITRTVGAVDKVAAGGVFTVTCIGADGQVKWEESKYAACCNFIRCANCACNSCTDDVVRGRFIH